MERKQLRLDPDVYGRMAWDKPAPTIKRECAHVGNGRYAHPSENSTINSPRNGYLARVSV